MEKVFRYLKDYAVITALLSILSYMLSYSFQKGINNFYGIDDVASGELDISSIVDTVVALSPIILIVGLLVLASKVMYTFFLTLSKWYVKLIGLVAFLLVYTFMYIKFLFSRQVSEQKLSKRFEYANEKWKLALKEWLQFEIPENTNKTMATIYNFSFTAFLFLGTIPTLTLGLTINTYKELFNMLLFIFVALPLLVGAPFFIFGKIEFLVNKIKKFKLIIIKNWRNSNVTVKLILLSFVIIFSSELFYQYGFTQTEQKRDFMLVTHNNKHLIILKKEKDFLITSEINLKKPILKNKFIIIENKPTNKDKELVISSIHLKDGLTLSNNKREVLYNRINSWLK